MFFPDNTIYTPVSEPNRANTRTPAERLSMQERLDSFTEIEKTYTPEQAAMEAERCLNCPTHWCQKKCPAGIDIPTFIAKIREGDIVGAYDIITASSTMPEFCSRVCPQYKQCQSECTRGLKGEAVAIGRLERYVVEAYHKLPPFALAMTPKAAPSMKRVAVIGSGPSGISAATVLAELGHTVTVYEKEQSIGGLLNYGIPGMKLDKQVLTERTERMRRKGVRFAMGTVVGKDITPQELIAKYDAVILCTGSAVPRPLTAAGIEGTSGIVNAVDYLRSKGEISAEGKDVVILGGGDTGNDCLGSALRQKCKTLTQVELMPKAPIAPLYIDPNLSVSIDHYVNSSLEEYTEVYGKDPHCYETTIQSVQADANGALESVTLIRTKVNMAPGSKRFSIDTIPGTEQTIPCQLLINATGFISADDALVNTFGLSLNHGTVFTNNKTYETAVKGVFACGDCRSGQSLVVKAMLDGRACAYAVDQYLSK